MSALASGPAQRAGVPRSCVRVGGINAIGVSAAPRLYARAMRLSRSATKQLILMRHAESEDQEGVRDHDRSISPAGVVAARSVARHLRELGWLPDLLLCSNSKRTKQTVEVMSDEVHIFGDVDVHYLGTLYTIAALDGMTKSHLRMRIEEFAREDLNCTVMCVGHNRGWEEAVTAFCHTPVKLATSNAALLQSGAASWQDALGEDFVWELVGIVTPEGLLKPQLPAQA